MKPLTALGIASLADRYVRHVLAHQEAEIQAILEEALTSGAMRGEVTVVMVYRAGEFPRLKAKLA